MATNPNAVPLVLIIRDGWGRNPNPEHDAFNAVKLAHTPVADRIERDCPTTLIRTSGEDVGLREGVMGNSEVGHQNIGAGRVVDQDAMRITRAIRDGSFFTNPGLVAAVERAKGGHRAVHLMGICSDAGVHGLLEHAEACLQLCKRLGHDRVFVHLFTDGRDTGPFTGAGYVQQVEDMCAELGVGRIASVIGRYWAMDRDNRWTRTERAYSCLTGARAKKLDLPIAASAKEAVEKAYEKPEDDSMRGDEFVPPTMLGASVEDALSMRIANEDTVIFYNYRGDRPRQLVRALADPNFEANADPDPETGAKGFSRPITPKVEFVTMTAYAEPLNKLVTVAYPKPPKMPGILGAHLSELGLTQFRCAETEKFAHVTFFFNDYREDPFEGENRVIVQSPKDVATYDKAPAMSAEKVRDAVLERLGAPDCEPVLIVNFANGDMVGHTGSLEATKAACETTDACVGAILDKLAELGGSAIVTADHGNAEQMFDPKTNAPHTAHTTYDVPLTIVAPPGTSGSGFADAPLRSGGRLADIAPTMLAMLGLPQPAEMTGESLFAADPQ